MKKGGLFKTIRVFVVIFIALVIAVVLVVMRPKAERLVPVPMLEPTDGRARTLFGLAWRLAHRLLPLLTDVNATAMLRLLT